MKKNEKVYLGLNTFNPSYICVKQGAKRILPGRKLGRVHDIVRHLARPEYLRELPRSRSQQATQADQDENYFLAEEEKNSHHGLPGPPEQLWRGVGEEFGIE